LGGAVSDAVYRSLADAVADALIVVDEQQRIVLFNHAAQGVFGYEAGDVVGRDLNVLLPEAYHTRHARRVQEFGERVVHADVPAWTRSTVWGRRSDGSAFPAEVSLSAVDVDGQVHMLASLRDVSSRVRMEQALEASESRFRAIFEWSPVAMALIDNDGKFITGNQAFHDQTGYSMEDVDGRWLGMIVHEDDRSMLLDAIGPVVAGDHDAVRVELRYVLQDGSVRMMDLSLAPIGAAGGGPRYMVGQAIDITRRIETQARLEETIRSKDELIASISHELRTPLTALVGFAELLQEGESVFSLEDRTEMIRLIVSESVDLTNIVDDLLVAARAEMGALTVAHVEIDLGAQVAQILEMWNRPEIEGIGVSGTDLKAWGDPARVRQIVRNLVSNAVKYGVAPINIELVGTGEMAIVAVHDRGKPISSEDRERIFEPYERAHQIEGVTASMGLGLAISRRLAVLMGGSLEYRRRDDGNVFELALPMVAREEA
jgi:protein-histidine pros-kinase